MQVLVASDHVTMRAGVRDLLVRNGHVCPAENAVGLDAAVTRFHQVRPDVLVLGMSPDAQRGLAVLADLSAASPARVLAVGSTADAKLILKTMRAGAAEFLDEAEWESELTAALARLQQDDVGEGHHGRVVAVFSASGGSGSSTLAANVAVALAATHQTCCLIDLKLDAGDLATLLDLQPPNTLAECCANMHRMDCSMFRNCFARHANGVHLLAAPSRLADVKHVTPEGVRKTLSLARSMFPYVVVDLDHTYDEPQAQVLYQADVVLLVMRLEFTALRQTRRALDYLSSIGVPTERIRLVINRYRRPRELRIKQAEDALGLKVEFYVPDDPKRVGRANNRGIPIVLESPRARVSRSIVNIAASVNGAPGSAVG